MKKIIFFVFVGIMAILIYNYFTCEQYILNGVLNKVETKEFYINNYSIFGNHFTIDGCIDEVIDNEIHLVLKNNNQEILLDSEFKNYDDKTCFYISENINEGIDLDEIETGKYLLLIKDGNLYYTLENKTEYNNLEYYTITKNNSNKKINIMFDNYKDKNYVEFKVKKEKLPNDVYDITIDPGHGGKDIGASSKFENKIYNESDLTLQISLLLKEELENIGLKVKLTRDDDSYLEPYGKGGRALIPNDTKSKYSLSIHFNSTENKINYGGVEIYTPNNINYDLATKLASNLSEVVGYSKKTTDRIYNGVYYTYFTKSDIKSSNEEMEEKGMKTYYIKEGAPQMYMIREVGGINTSAYIDGRNEQYGINNYYNSNQTAEPYLLELGYINYSKDIDKIVNKPKEFSKAISKTIKEHLNIS